MTSASRGAKRDSEVGIDDIEFLRRGLLACGRGDDQAFSQWRASWQEGSSSFPQHLVTLGVLKATAPSVLPLLRKGYARVPFEQLVTEAPAPPGRPQPVAPRVSTIGTEHRDDAGATRPSSGTLTLSGGSRRLMVPMPAPRLGPSRGAATLPATPTIPKTPAMSTTPEMSTTPAMPPMPPPASPAPPAPRPAPPASATRALAAAARPVAPAVPRPALPSVPRPALPSVPRPAPPAPVAAATTPAPAPAPVAAATTPAPAPVAAATQPVPPVPPVPPAEQSVEAVAPRRLQEAAAALGELDRVATPPRRRLRDPSILPPAGVRELRGAEIGRYRFIAQVAVRTSFVTYDGVDLSSDEPVSLLVLAPLSPSDDARCVSHVGKEIEASATRVDPRILRVRGWGRADLSMFVVTERIPHFTLRSLVRAVGALGAPSIRRMILEAAGALAEIEQGTQQCWPELEPDDVLIYDSSLHVKVRLPVLERGRWSQPSPYGERLRALASSWIFGLTGGNESIADASIARLSESERRCLGAMTAGDQATLPSWAAVVDVLNKGRHR
jgi:hypothetical protein